MLRDVFYYGNKPNAHPREKFATDLADARRQSTTEHFWIINEFCDYKNFDWDWDFDFLPDEDVWATEHNNVWPSSYQKDSGTWLCSSEESEITLYRNDVDPIPMKDEVVSNWKIIEYIDKSKFDFKWHPDPTDPPYIYVFGNEWYSGTIMPTVEYHVPGATEKKHVTDIIAHLLAMPMLFNIIHECENFDYSWRPDPTSPPYIYVFGNTQYPAIVMPTIEFHVPGATERKYIENIVPKLAAKPHAFEFFEEIELDSFDLSWVPDPLSPPYIYVWGNQWNKPEFKVSVKHTVEGATEYKYMEDRVKRKQCMDNWEVPGPVEHGSFDYSWEPDLSKYDPPFIYQFGTQWQKTDGPRYIVEGATEIKYIDSLKAKVVPWQFNNWLVPKNIDQKAFDFSWHPDSTEEPYIYQFGNQWNRNGGPRFVVEGATEVKYVEFPIATAVKDMTHWHVADASLIDMDNFDFSWHPDVMHEPLIYQFGTQWQKTSGPMFTAPGCTPDTPVKYMDIVKATRLPNKDNWEIPSNVIEFDYSWHPDSTEDPYIYQFPSQWNRNGGPRYVVEGATEIKYIDGPKATLKQDRTNWVIPPEVDVTDFDFSWHPDVEDKPYIYQFGTQWQKTHGPKLIVPGATDTKYVDVLKAKHLPNKDNWQIPTNIDSFDFSWHPDSTEDPYIYQFPSQWNRNGGPRYVVEGATEIKYIDGPKATLKQDRTNWVIPADVDVTNFDFSWHPDVEDKPYIYQFGTQWQKTHGPKLIVPDATDTKYVDVLIAKHLPDSKDPNWKILIPIDKFDYSWHPDSTEEPYIYVFGNQWFDAITEPTVEYHVPGATERKYIYYPPDMIATVSATKDNWETLIPVDNFDYSWRPHPDSPPYKYIWGNQWNNCELEPTVIYTVPGATDVKYMEEVATASQTNKEKQWNILIPVTKFDFSWRPDPREPAYIYVWGNKWNDAESEPTVIYTVEGATEYKFMNNLIATTQVNMTNWTVRNQLDLKTFDFSWRPSPSAVASIYEWGDDGPVYTVPDAKETINIDYDTSTRIVDDTVIVEAEQEIVIDKVVERPMFFVDRGNSESQQRFDKLKLQYPQLQKTRYLNSWVDTIARCTTKSDEDLFWVLSSEVDYTEFSFNYNPNPWQMRMIHVFGTQWTHWGNTYLVNRNTFKEDTKYVKVIEHLNVLNFVKDKRAIASGSLYDIVLIDQGNDETKSVVELLQNKALGRTVTTVKYAHSYLKTFKQILTTLPTKNEHYIWIASSICDYENFDFSYVCDPYAKEQLHVFPSDKQKFGDTFLVNINKLRSLVDDMLMLEDYEKVNYNGHQRVKRLPAPIFINESDTHVSISDFDYNWPYATILSVDNKEIVVTDNEPMSLWTPSTKNIIIHSTGGTAITVPKEAKKYVERELYDYPYISRSNKLIKSKPLDIVFLSNGETGADENYEHLMKVTKGLPNRVVRVDGVNGRVAAYHAAAEASETPWMFTVFAKLRVDIKFDWTWQPDRLQVPKHYIFNAKNPVNLLEYGHQAMIAYNKKITLSNSGRGLDFTLDDEHEVVDMLSGVAMYNTDEWSTWRTSFREALKLKATVVAKPDDAISVERLLAWSTIGDGDYGQFSIDGALDAIEYYDSVDGDMEKLKLSYDWPWLRSYFDKKYKT